MMTRLPAPPLVSPETQKTFDEVEQSITDRLNSPAYKFEQFLKAQSRKRYNRLADMSVTEKIMHYLTGYQPDRAPQELQDYFKQVDKAVKGDPIKFFFGEKDHEAVKKALEVYGKK